MSKIEPIRRVVTGNDAQGRSRVLFDSAAPNVKASPFQQGTSMTDIWVFDSCPAVISGERDDGNLPFHFEPPPTGGHLRIVQSAARPADYDPARDANIRPEHPPRKTEGGTWERGAQNLFTTRIHKSETLDYGILLSGERVLITSGPFQYLEAIFDRRLSASGRSLVLLQLLNQLVRVDVGEECLDKAT